MTRSILGVLAAIVTIVLIAVGTMWPNTSGAPVADSAFLGRSDFSTPENAARTLMRSIARHNWTSAYSSLANKSQFTEAAFIRDINGSHEGLRSYAAVQGFDVRPLKVSGEEAQVRSTLQWSSIVGTFQDDRDLSVVKTAEGWKVQWPIAKVPNVPPQVVPVNYLRWDVIYRGAGDDWGAQDVEAPHVRIVAMHPVNRGEGVIIMGEILNEDVVPAFVTVKATLMGKNGKELSTDDSFDKISHVLLPKQVSPFRIDFRDVRFSDVDSVRMQPSSSLISASADPVIGIESQKLNTSGSSSLTGQLVNQSGQTVNIAHVISTFYDHSGKIIWIGDQYPSRALLPQTPVGFEIALPADIAAQVANYRTVASTYSSSRMQ